MLDARDILLSPVISEKSSYLAADNVYTFKVDPRAKKPDIKRAVEALFAVKVGKVNILNYKATKIRSTRTGRILSRAAYKRAMIQVLDGEIDIYGL